MKTLTELTRVADDRHERFCWETREMESNAEGKDEVKVETADSESTEDNSSKKGS